jgi:serine/threonine protein kinase
LKVIDARYRDNPAYAERFLQEARSVATWRHNNILQVFYAGQSDDLYYFAMEYVDGADLSQVMKQYADAGELMPHGDVLKIGRAVASALDYAHSQGIIHRDVKPSNVMVAKDGRIALADFGLALNAQQGSFGGTFGTPHYIAPEQARSSAMAVPQSDLYALGVILYEMLTGSVPFDDPSPTALAVQHLTQPPPLPRQVNPNLTGATEAVLLKALGKQPEARYQTGAALMEDLVTSLNVPEADDEAVLLPPLPDVVSPVLSQTSVAERVSLYMPPPPPSVRESEFAALKSSPASSAAAPTTASKSFSRGCLIATSVVVLFLVGLGWLLFSGNDWIATAVTPATPDTPAAPTEPSQTIDLQTETTTLPQETEPTRQETAGDTAVLPTETSIAAPTTALSSPRLIMYYNETSFYLYNPNADNIRVSKLGFQPLDENGDPRGVLFEGLNWSSYYSFVEPFHCDRLEIADETGWLRPSQCSEYNASLTPELGHRFIFWTPRPEVTAFSVTWREEEVGRCDVTAGQCEVYLP